MLWKSSFTFRKNEKYCRVATAVYKLNHLIASINKNRQKIVYAVLPVIWYFCVENKSDDNGGFLVCPRLIYYLDDGMPTIQFIPTS